MLALFVAQAASAGRPRSETREFVLGNAYLLDGACEPPAPHDPTDVRAGGACFTLDAQDREVDIRIANDLGGPTAGTYRFFSVSGGTGIVRPISKGTFCTSVANVPVPAGARTLSVWAGTDPWDDNFCILWPPASGTITVDFR